MWLAAGLGIAWNVFGIVQLVDFVGQTHESLMMKGMSRSAADLYYALPVWMKLAFAVGSVGGLAGSVAFAARRAIAAPILLASLFGYIALYAGDYGHGVFEAVPGQMAILSTVVMIAIALYAANLIAVRRNFLS